MDEALIMQAESKLRQTEAALEMSFKAFKIAPTPTEAVNLAQCAHMYQNDWTTYSSLRIRSIQEEMTNG